jgi:hypothetical protein
VKTAAETEREYLESSVRSLREESTSLRKQLADLRAPEARRVLEAVGPWRRRDSWMARRVLEAVGPWRRRDSWMASEEMDAAADAYERAKKEEK